MAMRMMRGVLVSALTLAGVIAAPGAARAGPMTTKLMDTTRDTGWEITYDNTQVKAVSFTGNATGSNKGTLQLDKVFGKGFLGPIDIKFHEINKAAADSFGLRITLNENVNNKTGLNWKGYRMDLIDPNPLSGQANGSHPGFAHFHPDGGGYSAPPFSLTGSSPANPTGNKAKTLIFGKGTFADGTTQAWKGFGIHQYEDMGMQRDFTLREMAVAPEPSTLVSAFLAVGSSLLYVRARNRKPAAV